jgi:hypothetical protein
MKRPSMPASADISSAQTAQPRLCRAPGPSTPEVPGIAPRPTTRLNAQISQLRAAFERLDHTVVRRLVQSGPGVVRAACDRPERARSLEFVG